MKRAWVAIAFALTVSVGRAFPNPADYPVILRLAPRDIIFRQVQDSLSQGYQSERSGSEFPDLFICAWIASGGEDLFAVAARLSVPYETISSLNGLSRPRAFAAGEVVLVPSLAGLFIPDEPRNDLDSIIAARLIEPDQRPQRISVVISGKRRDFTFLPGARLYQTERSFFLEIGLRMPLPEGVITSRYGIRRSPIDGHDRLHEGVDLSAPADTAVLAAREGTVVEAGEDPILGLRIVIDHDGGLRTVYGHLSSIRVVLNQTVRSGTIIGAVGSTGLSTGPHLHFEIRLGGKAKDPSSYLPGLKP